MKNILLAGVILLTAAAESDGADLQGRYYGTNYTLPFAHGYRAASTLGKDPKAEIDRDVYHMARLGLNGFRIHLWDAELADSAGNLLDNGHLDLLDYLFARLEERGIPIIITAQTNFGNGYPERNIDTGAFTYDYDKCAIHSDPDAVAAQERYLRQLASHKNRYTGKRYAEDPAILAMEINNEPCHTAPAPEVRRYIDRMADTLRSAGWSKPILYNASHNGDVAAAYFESKVNGTTYQWYPVGLVSGRERRGNYLPYVDSYKIPFDTLHGFNDKFKVIYEFDPADRLDGYMYPAIARTFAREGFRWATQFAYDPLFLAPYNTEYQTHYLNLAYTPRKALSMMIAGEAMRSVPEGADYGKYPADTVFGDFLVSHNRDLAALNSGEKFLYTNSNDLRPKAPERLRQVAGYGTSPVVGYDGTGAYFLDLAAPGVWRLEVMPDHHFTADPFGKPSLSRPMAWVDFPDYRPMTIKLPGLGNSYTAVRADNPSERQTASDATIKVTPGVYLLGKHAESLDPSRLPARVGNIGLTEFVMPANPAPIPLHANHAAPTAAVNGEDLRLNIEAFGGEGVDSVVVYPVTASFWNNHNTLYRAAVTTPYNYQATIPATDLSGKRDFGYRVAVFSGGEARTFPDGHSGTPLDWDAPEGTPAYRVEVLAPDSPLVLLDAASGTDGAEFATIPDSWGQAWLTPLREAPIGENSLEIAAKPSGDIRGVLTKTLRSYPEALTRGKRVLKARFGEADGVDSLRVLLTDRDGITFGATARPSAGAVVEIPLDSMSLVPTLLVPAPYPGFLPREFTPEGAHALNPRRIEKLQFDVPFDYNGGRVTIIGAWLE